MTEIRERQSMAAVAVSATLTPAVRSRAQHKYGTQPLHEPIQAGMRASSGGWLEVYWWQAHADNVIATVCAKTGLEEDEASYFVAAAAWALHLYGQDTLSYAVADAARMAVAWHEGARSAVLR